MCNTGRRVELKKEVIERIKSLEKEVKTKTIVELRCYLEERGVTMTEYNTYIFPENKVDKKNK
ncbi:hypothetical protein ACFLZ9_02415 [Patescibacteria group bacterium]